MFLLWFTKAFWKEILNDTYKQFDTDLYGELQIITRTYDRPKFNLNTSTYKMVPGETERTKKNITWKNNGVYLWPASFCNLLKHTNRERWQQIHFITITFEIFIIWRWWNVVHTKTYREKKRQPNWTGQIIVY